jgi:hypothetical protein
MLRRILGGVGVVWGGAIIIFHFTRNGTQAQGGAYEQGQLLALIFGVVLLLAGLYSSLKG